MADSWAVKYRPLKFSDMVGNTNQGKILRESIVRKQIPSAIFLAGSRGTGKTSSGRIYARAICCENPTPEGEPCNCCDSCKAIMEKKYPDVIEVDAASENSVQGIRDLIKTLNYLPTHGDHKVIIIDECLTEDNYVLCGDGIPRKISKLKNTDSVFTKTIDNSISVGNISSYFTRKSKEIYCVNSKYGYVTGTPTHKMLVLSDTVIDYKALKDVKPGDYFIVPKRLPENNYLSSNIINNAIALILALVYNSGEFSGSVIRIKVINENIKHYLEKELCTYVQHLDDEAKVGFIDDNQIVIYSDSIVRLLYQYIINGELTENLYKLDRASRLMFFWITMLFRKSNENKYINENTPGVEVQNLSVDLGHHLGFITHQLGVLGTLRYNVENNSCDLYYIHEKAYSLNNITKEYISDSILFELIYREFSYLSKAVDLSGEKVLNISGYEEYEFSRVYEIYTGGEDRVYDFTVEETHNFIANGMISSNCHSLSQAATNALLKTLEEPPEFVKFVFCTTEPQKVLETIRSRCLMFKFNDITIRDIVKRLQYISDQEHVNIDEMALTTIARNSNGGMRDAVMLLEQVYLTKPEGDLIKTQDVLELIGSVSIMELQKLFIALKDGDELKLIEWIDSVNYSPSDILTSSMNFLETVIFIKQGVSPASFVPKDSISGVMGLASTISFNDVMIMFDEFRGIVYDLRNLSLVNSSTLFRLRMLGVLEKLKTGGNVVVNSAQVQAQQVQTFMQMVRSEFKPIRIPIPM